MRHFDKRNDVKHPYILGISKTAAKSLSPKTIRASSLGKPLSFLAAGMRADFLGGHSETSVLRVALDKVVCATADVRHCSRACPALIQRLS